MKLFSKSFSNLKEAKSGSGSSSDSQGSKSKKDNVQAVEGSLPPRPAASLSTPQPPSSSSSPSPSPSSSPQQIQTSVAQSPIPPAHASEKPVEVQPSVLFSQKSSDKPSASASTTTAAATTNMKPPTDGSAQSKFTPTPAPTTKTKTKTAKPSKSMTGLRRLFGLGNGNKEGSSRPPVPSLSPVSMAKTSNVPTISEKIPIPVPVQFQQKQEEQRAQKEEERSIVSAQRPVEPTVEVEAEAEVESDVKVEAKGEAEEECKGEKQAKIDESTHTEQNRIEEFSMEDKPESSLLSLSETSAAPVAPVDVDSTRTLATAPTQDVPKTVVSPIVDMLEPAPIKEEETIPEVTQAHDNEERVQSTRVSEIDSEHKENSDELPNEMSSDPALNEPVEQPAGDLEHDLHVREDGEEEKSMPVAVFAPIVVIESLGSRNEDEGQNLDPLEGATGTPCIGEEEEISSATQNTSEAMETLLSLSSELITSPITDIAEEDNDLAPAPTRDSEITILDQDSDFSELLTPHSAAAKEVNDDGELEHPDFNRSNGKDAHSHSDSTRGMIGATRDEEAVIFLSEMIGPEAAPATTIANGATSFGSTRVSNPATKKMQTPAPSSFSNLESVSETADRVGDLGFPQNKKGPERVARPVVQTKGLGRRTSKFRQSILGLADVISGNKQSSSSSPISPVIVTPTSAPAVLRTSPPSTSRLTTTTATTRRTSQLPPPSSTASKVTRSLSHSPVDTTRRPSTRSPSLPPTSHSHAHTYELYQGRTPFASTSTSYASKRASAMPSLMMQQPQNRASTIMEQNKKTVPDKDDKDEAEAWFCY